jgi:hypothetical protein
MPPRWLCWLIGMFWVTMTGWLFWRDLWPSWRPGEPPPFHIDDADEVLRKGSGSQKTSWIVLRQDGHGEPLPAFNAVTWMEYQKNTEIYTLWAKLTPLSGQSSPADSPSGLQIEKMESSYSIDQAGRLESLRADVKARLHFDKRKGGLLSSLGQLFQARADKRRDPPSSATVVTLHISGQVRGNQFFGHCRADADLGDAHPPIRLIDLDLPPTAVSDTGSVLMPLHPVNKISRLSLDQRWHQPLVDPLRDALPGLSNNVRSLNAHVLPQPQMLKGSDSETSCFVIEYTNDEEEIRGRTWVEQSSNQVLQQEAFLEGVRWIMKRSRSSALSMDEHRNKP